MKVNIGPYRDPFIVFTFLDKIGFPRKANKKLKSVWSRLIGERKIEVKIDNYDVWSADHTMALVILPILKMFREDMYGVPGDFIAGESDEEFQQGKTAWELTVDKMIFSFQSIVNDNILDFDLTTPEGKAAYFDHEAKVQEGLELFGKYFRNLWV